ncbi:uncharacterized protein LOC116429826 [Nomia melanderi]|uniref:uncharacterized protein LOC116429826 n=1 Tax=Nomia melanderi TaxID=2448451 RepID=UPI0013046219|nr:uncharacterized protein LOC116429826 [Nomia melanderi]
MKGTEMGEMKDIVLREIEPLLRQKLGNDVIVDNFTTKSLLPPGENYGSTILKVDVELRKGKAGKKEEIHLIGKMLPPTEFQRRIFDTPRTFAKEIFMYETIAPAYNKIELEAGLKMNEIFNFIPKFYGSRMSLQPDVAMDDDAVFLMENLKLKGYYHGDRSIGYDLEHSRIALKALARFHALGIAVKQKKPGLFEVFKMYAKQVILENDPNKDVFLLISKSIKNDPEISMYHDRCDKVLREIGVNGVWTDVPREPWSSIVHSDFWVNNVLFHRDDKGQIDDVKMIDFQMYIYSSPLRDLHLYLFTSVGIDVTDEQLVGLMDLYYDTIIEKLTQLGCNTKDYTKESFWEKMKEDAPREFVHIIFMIKVLTLDVKESGLTLNKMDSVLIDYEGSKMYTDRLRKTVNFYCKRGWVPPLNETS